MQRRSFLQPETLARTAGSIAAAAQEHSPPTESDFSVLRFTQRAMATTFEAVLPASLPQSTFAAEEFFETIDELEDQLSIYRDHSELSSLNNIAATSPVVVEVGLFRLLELMASLNHETQGAFDPACGKLIRAWGFYQRQGRIPTVAELTLAMASSGMKYVVLNPESRSVRYLRPLEINPGGIGKGYALDRAGEVLRTDWKISTALLSGGSSSVLALGSPGETSPGWLVTLKHPWHPEKILGHVRLKDIALGTSAATFQYFEYNGKKYGHLLDPRKGRPAEGIAHVSVLAPSAATADALSTAFFVLGVSAAREYCRTHPGLGVILLEEGASEAVAVGDLADRFFPVPNGGLSSTSSPALSVDSDEPAL